MAKKIHRGFNLLRDQLQEADKWDKIQDWVNGTARVIVILVEFVVIVCFGARIVMDRIARNLEQRLEENYATLESLKDTEQRLRQLQIDLQNYRGLWESSSEYSDAVREFYNYIPAIENSIALNMDKGVISVNGNASRSNIGLLEGIVKSSDKYQDTLLSNYAPDDSESTGDTLGDFELRTTIKNYKRKIFVGLQNTEESAEPTPSGTADPAI